MRAKLAVATLLLTAFVWAGSDYSYGVRARAREFLRTREAGAAAAAVDAGPDIGGFFELAPADGGGMGTACAGADITGANGETVTLLRASEGMCMPAGLVGVGLGSNSMPLFVDNYMRVMPDDAGILSLLVEPAATNYLTHGDYFDPGVWTATATVTDSETGVTNQFFGTTIEDTSAVAAQYVEQTYTTSTTGNWVFSTYIKGDTQTTVTLQLISAGPSVTTTCKVTGLSTTTWQRIVCARNIVTSVSSITVRIYPGDSAVVGDTGKVWSDVPQLERGSVPSSPIYTTTGPATRAADKYAVTGVTMPMVPSVVRVKLQGSRSLSGRQPIVTSNSGTGNYRRLWLNASDYASADRDSPTITNTISSAVGADSFLKGIYATNGASATVQVCNNGTCNTATTGNSTTSATGTTTNLYNSVFGYQIDGLMNQICVDSTTTRCNTY